MILQQRERDAQQGEKAPVKINQRMLHDIQVVLSRLVEKASQLLGSETTNLAECWMHIRSKFDGGKVINRSQSGSWEHRCMGAALQQNMGKEWGTAVWSKMTEAPPNRIFLNTAKHSAKKADSDRKRKATENAKQRRRSKYSRTDNTVAARKAYSRHDNSIVPDSVSDDVSMEFLEEMKTSYYQTKVVVTGEEAVQIERRTRNQAMSDDRKSERRKRLTASRPGGILKMRKKTKRSRKLKELLYSVFRGNEATRYGMEMEAIAQHDYTTLQQQRGHDRLAVEKCGLFVSPENPWLAASPDGTVHDPSDASQPLGLVEFKNPPSARDKTLTEACGGSNFCLQQHLTDGQVSFTLKPQHDYHYQIQCQLYCADREWCDFVLRTGKGVHIERIHRNRTWWKEQLPKLHACYFNAVLPELACPRYTKEGFGNQTMTDAFYF